MTSVFLGESLKKGMAGTVKCLVLLLLMGCSALFGEQGIYEEAPIRLGVDRFEETGFPGLKGKRVGLVTNPSGVNSKGISTADILYQAPQVNLKALFAPEHGLDGHTPAGEYVKTYRHKKYGIPVYSLYGDTRKPTPEMLRDIDVIVYDLQDIGCRSYTFISTLGLVMEAAGERRIKVIVLDRPNPLGGMRMEGPGVLKPYQSFVSQYDIPYVYGLTVGELARWIHCYYLKTPCELEIVSMTGWKRSMTWDDTGLKWVATSPNIPSFESALGYVATGLLGEIGITNGANEKFPFQVIASENLDPQWFISGMQKYPLKGVEMKPFSFKSSNPKYPGIIYSGVKLKIHPKAKANLTAISFYAIPLFQERFPKRPYLRGSRSGSILFFDKMMGSNKERMGLQKKENPLEIVKRWDSNVQSWKNERRAFLIYPE